jgi:hypothetical protein
MQPLIAFNLWQWIEQYRRDVEPPVGHQVIWEDSSSRPRSPIVCTHHGQSLVPSRSLANCLQRRRR